MRKRGRAGGDDGIDEHEGRRSVDASAPSSPATTVPRRVLITGVSHFLGGELARRLEEREDVEAIFGLDVADPQVALERTEFVHADTRHSVINKLVRQLELDTVVHCAVAVSSPLSARALHETDVIGTMNVLTACAGEASPVQRVVVKSSVAVYGTEPSDPSFLREEHAGRAPAHGHVQADLLEMEQLVQDFAIRNRRTEVTVLRLGNRVGLRDVGPLARYFSLPAVPRFLGYDPRVQLLHEDDAVEGLYRAVVAGHPGIFNVAGS